MTAPAAPATPAARGLPEILKDLQAAGSELSATLKDPKKLATAAGREDVAPTAIPAAKKLKGLMVEAGTVNPMLQKRLGGQTAQLDELLVLLGDKETTAKLTETATGTDLTAAHAKSTLLSVDLTKADGDSAKQLAAVNAIHDLVKAHPGDNQLDSALASVSEVPGISPEVAKTATDALLADGKSPAAQQFIEQQAAEAKTKGLEGKPLVIAAKEFNKGQFSTESYKGKVILVDFWATWCGPCKKELPRVKEIYKKYHPQGLEIVGVSCDNKGEDLSKFLAADPDMPWTQLFDEATAGWHPKATEYGIQGIPTMFLIDKKGVLRSVAARENMEEMIPKLLAE